MTGHARRFCLLAALFAAFAGTAFGATTPLAAVHWDDAHQRWRDIATNPYAGAQTAGYAYEDADVTVTWDDAAPTFKGTIAATGLKPNFAYQIKLNGKPTYLWPDGGDDPANERLGYLGRWWVDQYDHTTGAWVAGWNSTDSEYESWKQDGFTDGSYDYVFQGYLLFDSIVTDASGSVSKSFALDSSFHVLWKTSQRARTAKDSAVTSFSVVANPGSGWYSKTYRTQTVGLYAEWEPGRPLPGQCRLPEGNYNVRLFLTEESFHETATGSGSWATVMCHDAIVFRVEAPPPPPSPPTIESVTAGNARTGGPYDIRATVRNNDAAAAAQVTLDCKVSGGKSQALQRQTVQIPAGGTATVTWNDKVAPPIKAGTYTATVTLVETGATGSASFAVTK